MRRGEFLADMFSTRGPTDKKQQQKNKKQQQITNYNHTNQSHLT